MQPYQILIFICLFAIFLGCSIWLIVAYGVWAWRSRRRMVFHSAGSLIAFSILLLIEWIVMFRALLKKFDAGMFMFVPLLTLLFLVPVIRLWLNKQATYDFIDSRDLLLLKRPMSTYDDLNNPNKGVFVPSNIRPAQLEQVSFLSTVVIGWAIMIGALLIALLYIVLK